MIESYKDLETILPKFEKMIEKDQKWGHLFLLDPVRALVDAGNEVAAQFHEDLSNFFPEVTREKKKMYQMVLLGQKIPGIKKVYLSQEPTEEFAESNQVIALNEQGKRYSPSTVEELGGYNVHVQLSESAVNKAIKMAYDLELFPHEYNDRYDLDDLKELLEELLGIQIPGGNWGDIAYVQISATMSTPVL
jgi:hypothetical protein